MFFYRDFYRDNVNIQMDQVLGTSNVSFRSPQKGYDLDDKTLSLLG